MQELIKEVRKDIEADKEFAVKSYIKCLLTKLEYHKKEETEYLRKLDELNLLTLEESYCKAMGMPNNSVGATNNSVGATYNSVGATYKY